MLSETIATVMATATIVGWLLHLLLSTVIEKIAMRRLIWRYMRDSFMDEHNYMEAYRAMIRKAYAENAKEKFRK